MALQGSLQIRLSDYCTLLAASKENADETNIDSPWLRSTPTSTSGQATPVLPASAKSNPSLAIANILRVPSSAQLSGQRRTSLNDSALTPDQLIGQDAWVTRWCTLTEGEVAIWDDRSVWQNDPTEPSLVVPLNNYHCVKTAKEQDHIWAVSLLQDSSLPSTWSPKGGRSSTRIPRSTTCGSLRGMFQREGAGSSKIEASADQPFSPKWSQSLGRKSSPPLPSDIDMLPPPLPAQSRDTEESSLSAPSAKPWSKLTLRSRRFYKLMTGASHSSISSSSTRASVASPTHLSSHSRQERQCSSETDSSFASTGLTGAHSSFTPSPVSRISPLPDSACTTPDTFLSKRVQRPASNLLPHSMTFRVQSATLASQWASALSEHLASPPASSTSTLQPSQSVNTSQSASYSSSRVPWRSSSKRGLRQPSLSFAGLRDKSTSASHTVWSDASSPITASSEISPSVPPSPSAMVTSFNRSSIDAGFVGLRLRRSRQDLAGMVAESSGDSCAESSLKRGKSVGNAVSQDRPSYPPSSNRGHSRREESIHSSNVSLRDSISSRPSSSSGREALSPTQVDGLAGGVADRTGRRASSPLIFSALLQTEDRLAPAVFSSASSDQSRVELLDPNLSTPNLESTDRPSSRFALVRKSTTSSRPSSDAHAVGSLGLNIGPSVAGSESEPSAANTESRPRYLSHNGTPWVGQQEEPLSKRESMPSMHGLRQSTSFRNLAAKLSALRTGSSSGGQAQDESSGFGSLARMAAPPVFKATGSSDLSPEPFFPAAADSEEGPEGHNRLGLVLPALDIGEPSLSVRVDGATPVANSKSLPVLQFPPHSHRASESDAQPSFGSIGRKTWKTANRLAGAVGRITSPAAPNIALSSSPTDRPASMAATTRPATSAGDSRRPFSPEMNASPPVVERILPPEEIISTLDRIRDLDPAAAAEARQQLAAHQGSDTSAMQPSFQPSYPPSTRQSHKLVRPQTGPAERTTSFENSFESLRSSRQSSFSIPVQDVRNAVVGLHSQIETAQDENGMYKSLPAPPRVQKKPSAVGLRSFAAEDRLPSGFTLTAPSAASTTRRAIDGESDPPMTRDGFPSPTRSDGRSGTFTPSRCESPSERHGRARARALSLSDQWEISTSHSDEGDVTTRTEDSSEDAAFFGSFLSPDRLVHTAAAH